tara:strand:+ start:541 stop:657 length:117 start_codon:yes stop_codon:yes gene_type:complete
MKLSKVVKRYFQNGYLQARGLKRKKELTLRKYFKKLIR